jgi:LPXTG-motif cell wall-anchored protein
MVKKLGNFCLLIGFLCLVIFFTSSSFLVDQAWFLLGGLGFTSLGLLLKRRKNIKKARKRRLRRSRREQEEIDESY